MDADSHRISEKTVESIAEVAVLSVPGTCEIDAKLAGLAGRSFPRVDAHIDRAAASVTLQVEIITTYPAPVGTITDEVRQTVGTHVETLTGLKVTRVNIIVVDAEASPVGQRVSRDDVARHPVGVVPTPIEVAASRVTSPVVQEPITLAPISVDGSTYDNIRPVALPAPPHIEHVDAPDAPAARHVVAPIPHALDPIEVPAAPHPQRIFAPEPTEVRVPGAPEPEPLRRISVDGPVSLKPVTATRVAPFMPVERPVVEPLRLIQAASPRQLAAVSLPARKPLEPVHAKQPAHVEVIRPTPEPLRAISYEPPAVYAPDIPSPVPLADITVIPEDAMNTEDTKGAVSSPAATKEVR